MILRVKSLSYLALLFFRGVRGKAFLHAAGEVRHDAQDALDQHQLAAVVHFMFFHGKNHIEARASGRSSPRRHG